MFILKSVQQAWKKEEPMDKTGSVLLIIILSSLIVFMMPFYRTYPCGFSASKTGLIFTTSFSTLTNGSTLENYLPVMEPFFMISFKQTMLMGAVLSGFGIGVTFARGKEQGKEKSKEKSKEKR